MNKPDRTCPNLEVIESYPYQSVDVIFLDPDTREAKISASSDLPLHHRPHAGGNGEISFFCNALNNEGGTVLAITNDSVRFCLSGRRCSLKGNG